MYSYLLWYMDDWGNTRDQSLDGGEEEEHENKRASRVVLEMPGHGTALGRMD